MSIPKSVLCVVDIQNLQYHVRTKFSNKVKYREYLEIIRQKEEDAQIHAVAFGSQIKDEASGFIRSLENAGFVANYKKAKEIRAGIFKAYRLADMVILIMDAFFENELSTLYVGTSDVNLVPILSWCKGHGVTIKAFACNIPEEYAPYIDEAIEIDEQVLLFEDNTKPVYYTEEQAIQAYIEGNQAIVLSFLAQGTITAPEFYKKAVKERVDGIIETTE